MRGRIVSNWSREHGQLVFEIEIPANTTAEIYLPARAVDAVTEGGKPVAKVGGIKLLRREQDTAVFRIGSGHYRFEVGEQSKGKKI